MPIYFVRCILGGILTWLAACFMLFLLLVHVPGGVRYRAEHAWRTEDWSGRNVHLIYSYELHRPPPLDFLAWVLDVDNIDSRDYRYLWFQPEGIDFQLQGQDFKVSGLLTGDFGVSTIVAKGTPTLGAYGLDFPISLTFLVGPTLGLMFVACLQRRGRQPLRGYTIESVRQHGPKTAIDVRIDAPTNTRAC